MDAIVCVKWRKTVSAYHIVGYQFVVDGRLETWVVEVVDLGEPIDDDGVGQAGGGCGGCGGDPQMATVELGGALAAGARSSAGRRRGVGRVRVVGTG